MKQQELLIFFFFFLKGCEMRLIFHHTNRAKQVEGGQADDLAFKECVCEMKRDRGRNGRQNDFYMQDEMRKWRSWPRLPCTKGAKGHVILLFWTTLTQKQYIKVAVKFFRDILLLETLIPLCWIPLCHIRNEADYQELLMFIIC